MLGFSSRSEQRKEPAWTQAPSDTAQSEPAWRDASLGNAHQPSRVQGQAPSRSSSSKIWVTLVLAVIGLAGVAYLLMSMFTVVQDQVTRNKPGASGATGILLTSGQDSGRASSGAVK